MKHTPVFRAAFDQADALLDFDLKQLLLFEDPEGLFLNQTRYTQPCLLAMEVAARAADPGEGVRPQAVAGLSGEYAALQSAGVLSILIRRCRDERCAVKSDGALRRS